MNKILRFIIESIKESFFVFDVFRDKYFIYFMLNLWSFISHFVVIFYAFYGIGLIFLIILLDIHLWWGLGLLGFSIISFMNFSWFEDQRYEYKNAEYEFPDGRIIYRGVPYCKYTGLRKSTFIEEFFE